MDDGRGAGVEEEKPLQDLTAPVLQHLHVNLLEAFDVPDERKTGREIINSLHADPITVAAHAQLVENN